MVQPFAVVDVSPWDALSEEPMGSKAKQWLEDPDGVAWLFKRVREAEDKRRGMRIFGEDWAEKVASEVAGLLGVPVARIELAVRHGRRGLVSRSVLPGRGHALPDYELVHGNELLQRLDPSYDKGQRREATGYTLDAVWEVLDAVGPPDVEEPVATAPDMFAGFLVLDALVANTDRHHENWAIIQPASGRAWLSPSFDHATCLGFQEPDDRKAELLSDEAALRMWIERGRSNHFQGRPTLLQLAAEGISRCPTAVQDHWRTRLASLHQSAWDTLRWRGSQRRSCHRQTVHSRVRSFDITGRGSSMPAGLTDQRTRGDTGPRRFMVIWQDPETRLFHRVASLEYTEDGEFCFTYDPEASLVARFRPFAAFPDVGHEYRSDKLFPFFANRVMSERRPDFEAHLSTLGLTLADWTPLELLARSAGGRATDTVQVVAEPTEDDQGRCSAVFPVSGVRHIDGAAARVSALTAGQPLSLRREPDNPQDPRAVLIDVETNAPVGYVPSYLLDHLHKHWEERADPQVFVEQANGPDVAWHLRLLCRLVVERPG